MMMKWSQRNARWSMIQRSMRRTTHLRRKRAVAADDDDSCGGLLMKNRSSGRVAERSALLRRWTWPRLHEFAGAQSSRRGVAKTFEGHRHAMDVGTKDTHCIVMA
mmetsp:Transcript_131054/g.231611  ORF Transcript_131054/g.231611 Transcript_131054/m.231611 type:complete len:105 (+) Transcript_131054:966-1280(+)